MKKQIWLLIIPFILAGCSVGRTSESKGLDNEAFLQFAGDQKKYETGVDVFVDNNAPFKAKVNEINSRSVKGDVYVIKSGARHVKVACNNQVLYDKDIVVSSQETRQIKLP